MCKITLLYVCLALSALLFIGGYLIAAPKKILPTGIKTISENPLEGVGPKSEQIMTSPDGKKLALYIGYAAYVIKDVDKPGEIIPLRLDNPDSLRGWTTDSRYVIYNACLDKTHYKFMFVNIATDETSVYSVPRKSDSSFEKLWYVAKQDNTGKITMVYPTDVSKYDPLLQKGMLPYQVITKEGNPSTEEKEIWIRTKDKDTKILGNVGRIYQAALSPDRNRLFIHFTEPYQPADKSRILEEQRYVYDLATNKLYELPVQGWNFSWSPDGEWLMYLNADKSVDINLAESEHQKIKERKSSYVDWEAFSYYITNLFVASWDGTQIAQLTKDNEESKLITLEGSNTWIDNNKIAFFYLSFRYNKIKAKKDESLLMDVIIPSGGIKIGEITISK